MIFDSIENLTLYERALPGLETAIQILETENLMEKPCGKYTTDDFRCRYIISEYDTKTEERLFAVHEDETDVHVILQGKEEIHRGQRKSKPPIETWPIDAKTGKRGDTVMVDSRTIADIVVRAGRFVIFMSGEPHIPGLAVGNNSEKVRKVLFKLNSKASC